MAVPAGRAGPPLNSGSLSLQSEAEPETPSLWALSARELLSRTASHAPTPGGGSVAAISGALGLGLVIMALEVSLRRKNADAALPRVLDNARELLTLLARDADEDVAVFEQFMAALALPKSSEAEQHRRAALREAALAASRSPLAAAGRLVTALELAEQSAPLVARSIVSDVGAGAALLGGALRATLLSVDINLGQVDEDQRRALAGAREALAVRAQALEQVVAQRVQSRLT